MKNDPNRNQAPWFLLCWAMFLPAIVKGASANFTDCKPLWRVGQTWDVEVETMTQRPPTASRVKPEFVPKKTSYGYTFKVESLKEVDGEMCYQVRIQLVTINGNEIAASPQVKGAPRVRRSFYRIFNRTDDCSLKMFQKCDEYTEEIEASHKYSRGPAHAMEWIASPPLVFPIFSEEAGKFGPPTPPEPNMPVVNKGVQSWQKHEPSKDVWMVGGSEKPALTMTLYSGYPGSKIAPRQAEQIWIKGMPWPVQTEYRFGLNPPLSARLVRVDGSPIAAIPKPQPKQE